MWLANLGSERIDEVFNPELATRELTKEYKPKGLIENKEMAKHGGNIAKITRDSLEKELGRTVITNENTLNYQYIDKQKEIENKTE